MFKRKLNFKLQHFSESKMQTIQEMKKLLIMIYAKYHFFLNGLIKGNVQQRYHV